MMPTDFIFLAKSIGVIEGVVSDFKTDINIMEVAKTYLKSRESLSLKQLLTRENLAVKAYKITTDTLELPTTIRKALETVSKGRTRLNIEIMDWDKKSVEINKMVNRVVFAIIIAALVLASAVITASVTSVGLTRFSVAIFVGAGIMGLWLLISIIRSGTL